ncbi:MAG TPA: hypothetical protein VKA14_07420 [Gammaproteobacteria bacterium]|nr:hypothetical protein [Gammaproteobacteria bacterium]
MSTTRSDTEIPAVQQVAAVLWPSFLMSALATVLFFTAFDPRDMLAATRFAEMSRLGAYTVGFFLFWLLTTVSSALTCYFRRPCADPNRRPS